MDPVEECAALADEVMLVQEEIRWETKGTAGNSGACTCQPGGDGPPCPHGNFDIQYKVRVTDADRAKEILKEWHYEEEPKLEDTLELKDFLEIDFEGPEVDTPVMHFNDMTGEWEEE